MSWGAETQHSLFIDRSAKERCPLSSYVIPMREDRYSPNISHLRFTGLHFGRHPRVAIDNRTRSRARSRSSRGARRPAGRSLRCVPSARYRTVMRTAAVAITRYHPSKFRGGCVLVSGVVQGSSRRREALRFVRVTSLRPVQRRNWLLNY